MSVTYTHAHHLIEQAAEESRHDAGAQDHADASDRPTASELLQRVVPGIFFVPLAGPPVILLLGPWLLLVLLIIPPAALLITLVLVLVVGAAALAALGALMASPYLLVRHVVGHEPADRQRFAFLHRRARPVRQYVPVTQAKGTT